MIWATVSSWSYFCWLYRASPSLAANQSDFCVDHLVMSMCSLLLCCWKMMIAMTSAFSWQNSISLCPASFCISKPNLLVTPGVSWLPTFAFQSPIMRRMQWHPTPVLLPGKSHGRRSLVDCSPWGSWESDTTERLRFHFSLSCTGEGHGNPLQCSCLRIPGTGEPGGLLSMGSHRVGHEWSDLAAAAAVLYIKLKNNKDLL